MSWHQQCTLVLHTHLVHRLPKTLLVPHIFSVHNRCTCPGLTLNTMYIL